MPAGVGRTGECWDDAVPESFLATLKREFVNRRNYHSRDQAQPINPLLDRSRVQPPPASLHHRTPAAKRMGGQPLPSHSRIDKVSGPRGTPDLRAMVLANGARPLGVRAMLCSEELNESCLRKRGL